jgi:hypothetical protein
MREILAMSTTDSLEKDLNESRTRYDLVYHDLDGKWKFVNMEIGMGNKYASKKDAEDYLNMYRRGREDWDLRIVEITEHRFIDLV